MNQQWIVQYVDLDEGSAAMWRDIPESVCNFEVDAVAFIRNLREQEDEYDILMYRAVIVGSVLYYTQPQEVH